MEITRLVPTWLGPPTGTRYHDARPGERKSCHIGGDVDIERILRLLANDEGGCLR